MSKLLSLDLRRGGACRGGGVPAVPRHDQLQGGGRRQVPEPPPARARGLLRAGRPSRPQLRQGGREVINHTLLFSVILFPPTKVTINHQS